MLIFTALFWVFAINIVTAKPTPVQDLFSENDVKSLQLLYYFQKLEASVYKACCNGFGSAEYMKTGFPAGFRKTTCMIAEQEQRNADGIVPQLKLLGISELPACESEFSYENTTLGLVALANRVTSIGLGAYHGALETANSTVLSDVARAYLTLGTMHNTYLRIGMGASFPMDPNAGPMRTNSSTGPMEFSTGLSAVWAFNLAQRYVNSCVSDLDIIKLPRLDLVKPKEALNLQPPMAANTTLVFKWDPKTFFVKVDPKQALYIAMVNEKLSKPVFQKMVMDEEGSGSIQLPSGLNGAAFGCLTTFDGGLTMDDLGRYGTLAGPVEIMLS